MAKYSNLYIEQKVIKTLPKTSFESKLSIAQTDARQLRAINLEWYSITLFKRYQKSEEDFYRSSRRRQNYAIN